MQNLLTDVPRIIDFREWFILQKDQKEESKCLNSKIWVEEAKFSKNGTMVTIVRTKILMYLVDGDLKIYGLLMYSVQWKVNVNQINLLDILH